MPSLSRHSDKTLDILHGTPIVSVTFGASRVFTLKSKEKLASSKGAAKVQKIGLQHNSALLLDLATNAAFTHQIGVDKRPHGQKRPEENAYGGQRVSITIRCVATTLRTADGRLFGQGAVHKTEAELDAAIVAVAIKHHATATRGATVGNGMDPHTAVGPDEHGIDNRDRDADADRKAEELVMREAFRSENKKGTDFDWNEAYGNGYDVLGHTTRTELQSAP